MLNREKYEVDKLESVSEGKHICIYYYPYDNRESMLLIAVLTCEGNETVSEKVVQWLDSEYDTNDIKYFYENCEK